MSVYFTMQLKDELDMLRLQLTEHAERVHKFVVVEATVDHAGRPKPLHLQAHWEEFHQWHDQLEYIVAGGMPTAEQEPSFWAREQGQRDVAMPYLLGTVRDGDIVVVSDVDEVPSQAAMASSPAEIIGLEYKLRFAALEHTGSPGVCGVMAPASVLGAISCDRLRQLRATFPPFAGGGYHFSWFGGPESVRQKAVCSPHQESLEAAFDISNGYAWEHGCGAVGPGEAAVSEITDDYPEWVKSRECPWHWWKPGQDNLPLDKQAREREVERRKNNEPRPGVCTEPPAPRGWWRHQDVLIYGTTAIHEDGTPCSSALLAGD